MLAASFLTCQAATSTNSPQVEGVTVETVGTSRSAIQETRAERDARMILACQNVQRAVRDERLKLIRYAQVDREQFFDLQADPYETTNLAGRPEYAAKVAELTAALKQEMQNSGDNGVLQVAQPKPAAWSPPADNKSATQKPRTSTEP
jgi:arylsulfatase A-like enzyme